MTLLQKLQADQLNARKAKDSAKASLLTTLLGEIDTEAKRSGKPTADQDVLATVRKFLKGVNENIVIAGERRDSTWLDTLEAERDTLNSYLPQQMTKEEIAIALVMELKDKGKMMKFLKDNFAGKYDGKLAAQVVDELLKT